VRPPNIFLFLGLRVAHQRERGEGKLLGLDIGTGHREEAQEGRGGGVFEIKMRNKRDKMER
jgi:hypothetical protein